MQSYRNILAFVDPTGDLRAVEQAIALAQPSGRVVATKVVDLSLNSARDWAPDGWEYFREEVLATELANLNKRLASVDHAGVDLRSRVLLGRPSLELIRDVLEHGHDLVLKVAAGSATGRRTAFGSTGLHLVRKCPAPVWLLPRSPVATRRVVAAIHPGIDGDEARYALSQRVLRHAAAVASSLGSELHVAHVREGAPRGLSDASHTAKLLHRIGLTEQNAIGRVHRLLAELEVPAQLHLPAGEPEQELSNLVRSLSAHTLVLGSLGRAGIAGLLIGDLAEELLMRLDCGVFCLKPAGFDSPISRRAPPATSVNG
jgi:nucleotide-binding universal stress UspA family protein